MELLVSSLEYTYNPTLPRYLTYLTYRIDRSQTLYIHVHEVR